jgi:hypothetical protein
MIDRERYEVAQVSLLTDDMGQAWIRFKYIDHRDSTIAYQHVKFMPSPLVGVVCKTIPAVFKNQTLIDMSELCQ